MDKIIFRPAHKSDARKIAELYRISSDGLAEYIWTALAESSEAILNVGTRRYARENTQSSYQNCTIAELNQQVVGMLAAYPIYSSEEKPPEEDPVLAPYSKLEESHSLYISGVALFEKYRSCGIGSQLLAMAEQQAKDQAIDKLSLIVFEQNIGAKKLYGTMGYQEVARETIYPHPLIRYTGIALLMLKML
jgi:ribosomal protein S18 acetylase RimI-like enzyme